MPIFEYQCGECGTTFETIVFSNRDVICEMCQSQKVERLPSRFAIAGASNKAHVPPPASASQSPSQQQVFWAPSDEHNYHDYDD